LAHVVCEGLRGNYSIAEVESLKDFVFHELSYFQGADIAPTKYVPIFEWMIYVNLAKNIVVAQTGFDLMRVAVLRNFLEFFGYVGGDLKPEKTIEIARKYQDGAGLSAKIFDFGGNVKTSYEEVTREGARTYLENIENLKCYVMNTLLLSGGKVIVFYDELDDKFANNIEYKSGIISFLSAIEKVNNYFVKSSVRSKVCAILRSDIVSKLNSPNINRVFEDNAIFLNWEASLSRETELFDMLVHKIKGSSAYYKSKDMAAIFKELMPEYIAQEPVKVYVLHRSLGRPRDIVRMLTLIQEEYGNNLDKFEAVTFTNTAKKYSSYLKREIKSELVGHVDDEEIEKYFRFLSSIGKRGFTYEFAYKKYTECCVNGEESELKRMLLNLFQSGAICNLLRRSKEDGGNVFYWSYSDEDLTVNYDFNFEIHPGLWDALQIPKPRNRLS
jgi:hypothetical protein